MALDVTITRIMALFPSGVFLQWDLLNPTEAGTYLFSVYRGGSPEGPWEMLIDSVPNVMNYVDRISTTLTAPVQPNQLSLSRGIFYRVKAVPPSGTDNAAEVVSSVEPRLTGLQRKLKRKMLRDETVQLRRLNGVEVAVCKRMHWGARCPKCFDKYNKESVRGNCTTCYGTGFTTGYHTPIVTLARRSVGPTQTALTPQGKTDTAQTQITLLDAPVVEENDVLVFLRDNRRFLVKQQVQTELLTVSVHQKLFVTELARSDIAYRIKVDPLHIPSLF